MSYKAEFQANNTDLQAILSTVNNLPNKSSVRCGEFTTTTNSTSITLPEIARKVNVILMYLDTTSINSSTACVGYVNIQGSSVWHSISYNTEFNVSDDKNLLSYNKSTGQITLLQAYNEKFISGKYAYVAW